MGYGAAVGNSGVSKDICDERKVHPEVGVDEVLMAEQMSGLG